MTKFKTKKPVQATVGEENIAVSLIDGAIGTINTCVAVIYDAFRSDGRLETRAWIDSNTFKWRGLEDRNFLKLKDKKVMTIVEPGGDIVETVRTIRHNGQQALNYIAMLYPAIKARTKHIATGRGMMKTNNTKLKTSVDTLTKCLDKHMLDTRKPVKIKQLFNSISNVQNFVLEASTISADTAHLLSIANAAKALSDIAMSSDLPSDELNAVADLIEETADLLSILASYTQCMLQIDHMAAEVAREVTNE